MSSTAQQEKCHCTEKLRHFGEDKFQREVRNDWVKLILKSSQNSM